MVYGHAASNYQKTAVETADNLKLIIMCYEASIRDLHIAKEFHVDRRMEQAYEKIRHAQDLVTELLIGLDYEKGGEIAQNLSRLYNFVLRELIGVNSRKEASVYDPVIHVLTELKDAWEQVRRTNPQLGVSGANRMAQGDVGLA
jgi:flagellar protein FliS